MLTFALAAHFDRGYIAEPYWPERAMLIDIQKESGMNRARSTANRRKALQEYLESHDMSLSDYKELEYLAARPFHLDGDEIVIPRERVEAFLVATCDTIRAANRPCPPGQVRSLLHASAWRTGRRKADGEWRRFAVVANAGQKLSNQRGLRTSAYIADFDATGTLAINSDFVSPAALQKALSWGGINVGIGAARKMGWGRFVLSEFSEIGAVANDP